MVNIIFNLVYISIVFCPCRMQRRGRFPALRKFNFSQDDLSQQEQVPYRRVSCFSVIMAGDTQYPWTEPLYKGNDPKISQQLIRNYFTSMSRLKNRLSSCSVEAVIINGDLTAFGHEEELNVFKRLLEEAKSKLNVSFYLGLGNHDYANNVQDCWRNRCARRMLLYVAENDTYSKNMDLNVTKVRAVVGYSHSSICPMPEFERIEYTGSFSYWFDIGDVRFIQLHNYPTYNVSFSAALDDYSFIFCRPRQNGFFNITPSLDWLERQIQRAKFDNKSIVLCFHDPGHHFKFNNDSLRFKKLINDKLIAGLFVGHFHDVVGRYRDNVTRYGNAKLFASGSAIYQQYLLVKIYKYSNGHNRYMRVQAYNSTNGSVILWPTPRDHLEYII